MRQTVTTPRPAERQTERAQKRAASGANERATSAAATSKPAADQEMRCTLCGLSACWT